MNSESIKVSREQPLDEYDAILSGDGWLTLPEECITDDLREGERIYFLTYSLSDDLCLYTPSEFEIIKDNLFRLNSMDLTVRDLRRHIIGQAIKVCVDDNRRIKIPVVLLENIGDGTHISINKKQEFYSVTILKYPNRIGIAVTKKNHK